MVPSYNKNVNDAFNILFGTLPVPTPMVQSSVGKEPTMYNDECCDQYNEVEVAKERLISRVHSVEFTAELDLLKKFGLTDDTAPQTSKELVERIEAGNYILPEKNVPCYINHWCGIRWRNPKLKEDHPGFDAAFEKFKELKVMVKDEIIVLPPAEGLKSLREFEKEVKKLVK